MEEKERYIIDRFDEDIFDTKKEYILVIKRFAKLSTNKTSE